MAFQTFHRQVWVGRVWSRRREAVVGVTIWRAESRRRLYYSEPPFGPELARAPNDRLIAVSMSTLAAARGSGNVRQRFSVLALEPPPSFSQREKPLPQTQRMRSEAKFGVLQAPPTERGAPPCSEVSDRVGLTPMKRLASRVARVRCSVVPNRVLRVPVMKALLKSVSMHSELHMGVWRLAKPRELNRQR